MRIVVEIKNGAVSEIVADHRCEVLIIDRDEPYERCLRDGEPGSATILDVPGTAEAVGESYALAGFESRTA